jgi:hypothetical protein
VKKESIIELRKQGLSYGAIAYKVKCNKDYVRKLCCKEGLGGSIGLKFSKQIKKKCMCCGKDFICKNKTQRYCSSECRLNIKIKECVICSGKFETSSDTKETCSKECTIKHSENKRKLLIEENKKRKIYEHEKKKLYLNQIIDRVCENCGKVFRVKRKSQKRYCSNVCSQHDSYVKIGRTMTHEQYVDKVNKMYKGEIEVKSKFIFNEYPIDLKCKKCGKEYTLSNARQIFRSGCSCQSSSKGEKSISNLLDEMDIKYEKEKTFDDLVYLSSLRFDFYLPDHNLLIEYDGIHHFKPIEKWGGKVHLYETLMKDEIKNNYAKDNNIKLIRIPYWEKDNLKRILNEQICTVSI